MLRALAAIWLIWGMNWVVMKLASAYFPPILFVTWRFAIGAVILAVVAYWRKIPLPQPKLVPWIFLSGIFLIVLNNIAAQIGVRSISAGMAAVLNYTAPLWTAILAHFTLNEKLTRRKVAGIFVALIGLYVLMGLQGVDDVSGAIVVIFGAIAMAVSSILIKLKLNRCDMIQLTTWQMIFSAVVLVIYSSLVPQGEIRWCAEAFLFVLYNGVLASALAFFLWNYVLTHIEAGTASIATLVAPVVGVLGGVIFLGEPFTAHIVSGIVLIFAGIILVADLKR